MHQGMHAAQRQACGRVGRAHACPFTGRAHACPFRNPTVHLGGDCALWSVRLSVRSCGGTECIYISFAASATPRAHCSGTRRTAPQKGEGTET